MKVESRKVSDSRVETVHIVRPNHLNAAGRLFGGMLMQWIDEVGRTSMDIKVDSYVESMDGTRTLINHAYLTVVALNQNDHPIPVPRLEPTTEDEAAEWEEAKRRRELRKSL